MIKLYDTKTSQLREFAPLSKDKVTLYTCGPTVYSEPHIGNWVAFIRWDILVRTLRLVGYRTERVMNITDVGHLTSDADEGEDKMIKGAKREGITEWDVAKKYTELFLGGMKQLNLVSPEHITKATDHIDIQIELVKALEEKGFTYILDDGVYYDTSKFPKYADFAKLDIDAQQAGKRVVFHSGKRNSSDFVVWRLTPPGETRAMEWDSPWGKGIPGWHLECSAMAMHYLGKTIDIHTGGIDHIPVHHTNEIAQSEAANGIEFARYWLHCNHLLSNGTKLSKSLSNSYTLSQIKEKGFSAMDFKMFILQSHYRTETNFTWENLSAAHNRLMRWKSFALLRWQTINQGKKDIDRSLEQSTQNVLAHLSNDLNTPKAIAEIEQVLSNVESSPSAYSTDEITAFVQRLDDAFGLELEDSTPDISDEQKNLIAERHKARADRDWPHADEIRDMLAQNGIALSDAADGQIIWSRT